MQETILLPKKPSFYPCILFKVGSCVSPVFKKDGPRAATEAVKLYAIRFDRLLLSLYIRGTDRNTRHLRCAHGLEHTLE
jgi:hypothetical protein